MAMDLDELDVLDEDDIETPSLEENLEDLEELEDNLETPSNEEEENSEDNEENSSLEDDAIDQFLKSKGISDSSKIKFENDNGEIEEVSWDDLSEEEKLNILNTDNTKVQDDSNDLDDDEIDFINRARLSGMSMEDFITSIKQLGANEYALSIQDQLPEYNYTVDDLSDEELYVLDLKARMEDISDEECAELLDRAMSNEELFKKEVTGLREDYKRMEDERNERDQALAQQQYQEQYELFANNVIYGINNFKNIGTLDVDMDDNDKNQLYQFITGTDLAGVNYFLKALSDPDTMVKTAWFALHGEDIINNISEYYKNQILAVAKANYERGKEEAKPKKTSERKVVVKHKEENKKNVVKSIDDLD